MDIKGKGRYIGGRKIEIEDIKPIESKKQKNEPLENCFAGLVDNSIDLEDEIRTVRKETQQSLEKNKNGTIRKKS